jgi:hypothetical protein
MTSGTVVFLLFPDKVVDNRRLGELLTNDKDE